MLRDYLVGVLGGHNTRFVAGLNGPGVAAIRARRHLRGSRKGSGPSVTEFGAMLTAFLPSKQSEMPSAFLVRVHLVSYATS